MLALVGCMALAVLVFYADQVRRGLEASFMFSLARWLSAIEILAGIGATALLAVFVGSI